MQCIRLCYCIDNLFIIYRKNSKICDTSNNCHNRPKNRKVWCNIALMHPKDADGMANSVDPDQTASSEAVWSWSALFAETYLSQYIEFVRYLFLKRKEHLTFLVACLVISLILRDSDMDSVGWLVVLGLTALWDNISVYIRPSPEEREKEKRNDRRE